MDMKEWMSIYNDLANNNMLSQKYALPEKMLLSPGQMQIFMNPNNKEYIRNNVIGIGGFEYLSEINIQTRCAVRLSASVYAIERVEIDLDYIENLTQMDYSDARDMLNRSFSHIQVFLEQSTIDQWNRKRALEAEKEAAIARRKLTGTELVPHNVPLSELYQYKTELASYRPEIEQLLYRIKESGIHPVGHENWLITVKNSYYEYKENYGERDITQKWSFELTPLGKFIVKYSREEDKFYYKSSAAGTPPDIRSESTVNICSLTEMMLQTDFEGYGSRVSADIIEHNENISNLSLYDDVTLSRYGNKKGERLYDILSDIASGERNRIDEEKAAEDRKKAQANQPKEVGGQIENDEADEPVVEEEDLFEKRMREFGAFKEFSGNEQQKVGAKIREDKSVDEHEGLLKKFFKRKK